MRAGGGLETTGLAHNEKEITGDADVTDNIDDGSDLFECSCDS